MMHNRPNLIRRPNQLAILVPLQVIGTVIHPLYSDFSDTVTNYDIAVHRLAIPSTKSPAQLKHGTPVPLREHFEEYRRVVNC